MSVLGPGIIDSNIALGLGACVVIFAGAVIVVSNLAARRKLLSQRVELLTESSDGMGGPIKLPQIRTGAPLIRGTAATPIQREAIRQFERFGLPPSRVPLAMVGLRLAACLLLVFVGFLLGPHVTLFASSLARQALLAMVAGAFGWHLPQMILGNMSKDRAATIAEGLPDAIDLLVICTESGLALESAIGRVAVELRLSQPALAAELLLTAADLRVLPSSEQALAKLAERVDLPPVRALATTLAQTMRFGTPLAQALRVVSAEMRNDALVRLEERGNKLPALMTIPMILLILPTIFLILAGPAVLAVLDMHK